MRLASLIVTTLVLMSCTPAADTTPTELSATKEELGQMNRDFAAALNAGDATKAASYYAEDAVIIPPGEAMVSGRPAIEAYWKGALAAGMRDAKVATVDAKSSGSQGWEIGTFELTVNGPDGKPMTDKGRYIELLRRGADGKWYSTAGIWNSAPQ